MTPQKPVEILSSILDRKQQKHEWRAAAAWKHKQLCEQMIRSVTEQERKIEKHNYYDR